jgi:hypothetical protein
MNRSESFLPSALALALCTLPLAAQGTFPPTTAPGTPIMKSLDQIESRTPVSSLSALPPYAISASGSYYLTGNITVTTGTAIQITGSGVTLDLNGFSIISSASPTTGNGIEITGSARNIVVRNGTVQGGVTLSGTTFSGSGFSNGIYVTSSGVNFAFRDLIVTGMDGGGIYVATATRTSSSVTDCVVSETAGTGILAGRVQNCTVSKVGLDGINALVVTGCNSQTVSTNPSYFGIDAYTVADCAAVGNAGRAISAAGNIDRCYANSTSNIALYAAGNIANSSGTTASGSSAVMAVGTVSYTRANHSAGGLAINAAVVVGCLAPATQTITGTSFKQFSSP